jgi:hypothetical protein
MAGPFDFTGQDIENTYQRVLQITGSFIYDGTGSLVNTLNVTASFATTASYAEYAVSASHEITHETSSSYAETASIHSSNSIICNSYKYKSCFKCFIHTASYVENAHCFICKSISSSFASTHQYAQTASFVTLAASYVKLLLKQLHL